MTALPDEVTNHPLREESEWLAKRDSGIAPLYQSELTTTQQSRDEFLVGAWLLGILATVHPQMLRIADMLNGGALMNAVIMPRRSAKTTTLFCILLGRCYLRPVHFAAFTLLTTQKKSSERYRLDVYGPIARRWPEDDARPVKLIRSNGSERVEFPNGSVLSVLSPDGDAVRSGAYDTLLLDEAGESSPERWEDIIGAVIPAFDTRPEGQLILAGTAGDYRDGSEFWKTLHDERAGRVAYMLADDTDPEELEAWVPDADHPRARARELTLAMHPGIGTLTTLDRIENSYERLGVKKYTREYFNLFGAEGSNTALIPQPLWLASALPDWTEAPKVSALCIFVHPDADWASMVQAWKDKDGRTHVAVLHHQDSVKGFAKQVIQTARKLGRAVTYDSYSPATENVMKELRTASPRVSERPMLFADVKRASVHFMTLLREDKLRHYSQAPLDSAVEIAVKRQMGNTNSWAFGRPKGAPDSTDITPIEAAALAAYALEDERAAAPVRIDFFDAA
ncbi:hypothetical protein BMW26_07860 [Microbacterium sp. 1.5R]|uniref:hypothetical protein n=1 Tax=Microbacterium sp. 1.5R TaxID=1916917 RepID=UPI000909575E|nr:hypothetical protein [Microbacterium sp. 1.5R]APH44881.1 hypothetical protein BMW26_07860 [Microbacterium sp. 1.5R]